MGNSGEFTKFDSFILGSGLAVIGTFFWMAYTTGTKITEQKEKIKKQETTIQGLNSDLEIIMRDYLVIDPHNVVVADFNQDGEQDLAFFSPVDYLTRDMEHGRSSIFGTPLITNSNPDFNPEFYHLYRVFGWGDGAMGPLLVEGTYLKPAELKLGAEPYLRFRRDGFEYEEYKGPTIVIEEEGREDLRL